MSHLEDSMVILCSYVLAIVFVVIVNVRELILVSVFWGSWKIWFSKCLLPPDGARPGADADQGPHSTCPRGGGDHQGPAQGLPRSSLYLHTTSKDARKIGVHNNVACLKDQAFFCKTKLIESLQQLQRQNPDNHKLEMYHQHPDKGLLTLVGVTVLFQTCIYFIKKYR